MRVLLVGVSCVGKTTIGAILARRLGIPFLDLDDEVEKNFGTSIERLQGRFLTDYSYRKECAQVLKRVAKNNADCVIALPPSGLMDAHLRVVRKLDCATVVVEDTPENIVERAIFFDIDSKPFDKHLTDEEKQLYRREIKGDLTYFRRSYARADLRVDIAGLDAEAAAMRIEALVRENSSEGTHEL